MNKKTVAKHVTYRLLHHTFGYKRLRHLGRWLAATAGADGVSDDWTTNGEQYLVEAIFADYFRLRINPESPPSVVLEVGSNHGQQTLMMCSVASHFKQQDLTVHAFEPSSHAHSQLKDAILHSEFSKTGVILNRLAVGGEVGSCALHCFDEVGGGINSIYDRDHADQGILPSTIEHVEMTTIDAYVSNAAIVKVLYLKIDTEGNDAEVLAGADQCLRRGLIDYIQFEYNSSWIDARRYLKDVFKQLQPVGYRIGKLHDTWVEEFVDYSYKLEWFEQANYIAWRSDLVAPFRIDRTVRYLAF